LYLPSGVSQLKVRIIPGVVQPVPERHSLQIGPVANTFVRPAVEHCAVVGRVAFRELLCGRVSTCSRPSSSASSCSCGQLRPPPGSARKRTGPCQSELLALPRRCIWSSPQHLPRNALFMSVGWQ
jgi:hypothetical protein